MNTYAIPTQALKAVSLFSAKKDVRYYLKGVHFTNEDSEKCRISASNGHTLATYTFEPQNAGTVSIVIPSETVELALKIIGKNKYILLTIDGDKYALENIGFTPIDGTFPNIKRAWPEKMDGKPVVVNPEYYSLVGKAAKLMGLGLTGNQHYFDSVINRVVYDLDDLKILIMGIKDAVGDPENFPKL